MDAANLPTRAQIDAITDLGALNALREDVEKAIDHIEAQLEFSTGDDEWARRATSALGLHRFVMRGLCRRIAQLTPRRDRIAPRRPRDACDPLTLEVLDLKQGVRVNPATLESIPAVERDIEWMTRRIDAMTNDRLDEIGLPQADRDERFMAATDARLRQMRSLKSALTARLGQLRRQANAQRQAEQDRLRERQFIAAASDLLDRETYLKIWARVDQERPRETEGDSHVRVA
jgi:hypothetical protein